MYALIKTHKAGNAPRPIVNTCNSPGYTIAKTITKKLTTLARDKKKYNVLNSQAAIKRIKSTRILPDMKARSYDARCMFHNISIDKAILAVRKRQGEMGLNNENMNLIIECIKFVCITNTEIIFNDHCYKQIKGLRMGSSLSPILADFVMEDLLDSVFLQIPQPLLFIKYVDDILTFTTDEDHETILKALNEADDNLKFDHEVENEEGMINYLDFTVINRPFNVKTKWYQKHIASGRFINHFTHHPKSVIHHTAVQFVANMILNSDADFFNEIINRANHLLHLNSYPIAYIKRIITIAQEKIFLNMPSDTQQEYANNNENDPTYVTSLQFIPRLTNNIQSQIEASAASMDPEMERPINIKVASQPIHKMSTETYNRHKKIASGKEIPTVELQDDE